MSSKYLEISSTRRNRNEWPLPSNFEVLIAQSGTKTQSDALDPVCLSSPIKTWSGEFDTFYNSNSIAIKSIDLSNSTTSPTVIVANATGVYPGGFQTADNYYIGASLNLTNSTYTLDTKKRIIGYKLIFPGTIATPPQALITVSSAFNDLFFTNDVTNVTVGSIENPADPSNASANIFIPSGSNFQNFYKNLIIQNITQSSDKYRRILSYDNVTHVAVLGDITTGEQLPAAGWSVNNDYTIRGEQELFNQLVQNSDSSYSRIALEFGSPRIEYKNNFVRISDLSTSNYNTIRRIVSYFSSFGSIAAVNGSTVTLALTASTVDDYYKDMYITIAGGAAGNTKKVVSYNGNTKVATLESALTGAAVGVDYQFMTLTLHPPFTYSLAFGEKFEMLGFSYDNFVPMNYSGSLVSQQEMTCYEIELVNLILPNVNLKTGSRIAFYPYFYVELQNVSAAGSGIKGAIYSNNPASTRMLFRCAIDDLSDPTLSPFIKINGDGMRQIIKFKPNDNLKFSVHLPTGELFETIESDYFSPLPPNNSVQINALFNLIRL